MSDLFRHAAEAIRACRYEEAERVYEEWLSSAPSDPRPAYGLGTLLLARGEYRRGWELYEARTDVPETRIQKPKLSFPEWRGEPIGSLLIWPEQGLGDQIMFARYVPILISRGINVTLLCPPPLARLLSETGAKVISAHGRVEIPRHDAWILSGSLPSRIGMLDGTPYLPGEDRGSGIGIMTKGNPNHIDDINRSLPDDLIGKFNLLGRNLHPNFTQVKDFAETADIIRRLDLVISVDTAVAHLAGAMGKTTYLLLPYRPDWRWGHEGQRTIWYSTVQIFRQPQPGDWNSVLKAVDQCVRNRSAMS